MRNETIGKVVIDKTYYPNEDRYTDGDQTEEQLLKIVSGSAGDDYTMEIAEHYSWPILYHLSVIRENILNWYPFHAGERILEIGAGCGAVTGALLHNGAEVTAIDLSLRRSRINAYRHRNADNLKIFVGASEEILPELQENFDHVTLIGVLEYAAQFSGVERPFHYILEEIHHVLKENGRLWVAIENKLGLKYLAGSREDHTGRYFESIEGYPHHDGPRTFSRKEIIDLAEETGFQCRFYYPYPDYKFPNKIYSDGFLPRKGELIRNWQNLDADRVQLFDERAAFDSFISAGLFPEVSNSFLIEMKKAGGKKA